MMKIARLILHKVEIPLRTEFRHALKTWDTSQSVIVEIVTDDGIHGYGEGTPREYVTGESTKETLERLYNIGEVLKREEFTDHDWKECFSGKLETLGLNDSPSARCALELALMDSWGKQTDQLAVSQIGSAPIRKSVQFSGVISGEDLNTTRGWLLRIHEFGFKQVKLKVGKNISSDLERIALSKSILGPDVEIRIDANGSWVLSEAVDNIHRVSSIGVCSIEQPLPVDAKEDYPRLMEQIGTNGVSIIVDESICNENDAIWFISNRGASGFNLKISKHGGLWPSYCIYKLARKAGMTCQLGCHVGETALLTSAGRLFSTISRDFQAFEGSFGRFLLKQDITMEDMTFGHGGFVDLSSVYNRSGLGVEIDRELLRKNGQRIEV